MIDFKIVKGGFYRRRDGLKVECTKDDCDGAFPVLLYSDLDNHRFTYFVMDKGYHFADGTESKADIVGVWEEPKPKRLCYRYVDDGSLQMLSEKELMDFEFHKEKLERYPCALDEL